MISSHQPLIDGIPWAIVRTQEIRSPRMIRLGSPVLSPWDGPVPFLSRPSRQEYFPQSLSPALAHRQMATDTVEGRSASGLRLNIRSRENGECGLIIHIGVSAPHGPIESRVRSNSSCVPPHLYSSAEEASSVSSTSTTMRWSWATRAKGNAQKEKNKPRKMVVPAEKFEYSEYFPRFQTSAMVSHVIICELA